jgi:hypothetical protein
MGPWSYEANAPCGDTDHVRIPQDHPTREQARLPSCATLDVFRRPVGRKSRVIRRASSSQLQDFRAREAPVGFRLDHSRLVYSIT